MSNQYAMVMTADIGYLEMATAVINGAFIYENMFDIHLLVHKDVPEAYTNQRFPSNVYVKRLSDVLPKNNSPTNVRRGGVSGLKFGRYYYASVLCSSYKSILIFDSDMLLVDNIMEQFKISYDAKELVMVRNNVGITPPEQATLGNVLNAVSPPYHCTGTFFNCEKFQSLLKDTWDWSFKEGFSDMATLFRTIIRSGYPIKNIISLKNQLWIWTRTYSHWVGLEKDNKKRRILLFEGERIKSVHGKWASKRIRWRELAKVSAWTPEQLEKNRVYHNIKTFLETVNWLNKEGPVKWFSDKCDYNVIGAPK